MSPRAGRSTCTWWAGLALLWASGCAAPGVTPLRYRVAFDPAGRLEVEVTGLGRRDEGTWRSGRRGQFSDLALAREAEGWSEAPLADRSRLQVPAGTTSLRYACDLTGDSLTTGAGQQGGFLVDGRAYLFRPGNLEAHRQVEITFQVPGPLLIPWALSEPTASGRVAQVRGRDLWDPGFHTFGVEPERLELPGGVIELAVLPARERPPDALLRSWIEQAGRELLTARASFPQPRVPVTLVPIPATAASPFGKVLLSRPPSVALYVGAWADEAEFARDWVAVHELFHLAEPRFAPAVPWLSEGVATYYQGLARLRSGRLPARTVWSYLRAGLFRGLREAGGRALPELSRRMHELHCYQAVYWGGAAFALELDLELRRLSGGRHSLDTLLEDLVERGGALTLEGFARAADAAAGEPLYARLAGWHLEGPALRRVPALLERLALSGPEPFLSRASPEREALARPYRSGR